MVYTMTSHGMNIDLRHIMLLADLMTFKVSLIDTVIIWYDVCYNVVWYGQYTQKAVIMPYKTSCNDTMSK